MTTSVVCPCGKRFACNFATVGQTFACSRCGHSLTVKESSDFEPKAAPEPREVDSGETPGRHGSSAVDAVRGFKEPRILRPIFYALFVKCDFLDGRRIFRSPAAAMHCAWKTLRPKIASRLPGLDFERSNEKNHHSIRETLATPSGGC
jgi:hypothetical protein